MLAERALRLEAGDAAFLAAASDLDAGNVRGLRFARGTLTARVRGARRYRVQVVLDDSLAYACDCPVGEQGVFCRHCAAALLAWIDSVRP